MPIPLALIPAAFQIGTGISQMIGGRNQLNNLERPAYEIPQEIRQAVGLAKGNYADPRFVGQANLERQSARSQANALNTAQSRGTGMYQVGAIQSGANDQANQIATMQAAEQRKDQSEYSNMLNILAKYKDQEFQLNKLAPYQDKYNEGRERIGAGQSNIFGALDNAATIGTRLLSASQGQSVPQAAGAATSNMQRNDYLDTQLAQMMRMLAGQGNFAKNAIYNAF